MIIGRRFTFSSAHNLPEHGGKCKNLHGHNYVLEVEIEGYMANVEEGKEESGMVMDYAELDSWINKMVIDRLDHSLLNDFISYPTAESMLIWIKEQLVNYFLKEPEPHRRLHSLKLWENERSWAKWTATPKH